MRHSRQPGRSGHARSLEADRLVYRTRSLLARFFNAPDPSCIVFTLNATDALNLAIKGLVEPGDHVIFTAMEHNSVLRALGGLRRSGTISTTMVPCDREGFPDLDFLERSFQRRTRLVICNHASNVSGTILPVEEICRLAHAHGAHFLLDAAQTAGVLPLDVAAAQFDLLAFAGHKSLLGPPGTGGLYVRPGLELKPWREGGTGSHSEQDLHPETMPERLEAGTLNGPGLAGLEAGVSLSKASALENICRHERQLRAYLKTGCKSCRGCGCIPLEEEQCVAVLSLLEEDCGELGHILENSTDPLRTADIAPPWPTRPSAPTPGNSSPEPGTSIPLRRWTHLAGALEEIIAWRQTKKCGFKHKGGKKMKEIDCRGLNCPEPVLRTKKALEEHGPDLLCIVNSKTARENIIRFARSRDLEASWEQKGTDYHVRILSPREAKSPSPRPEETPCSSREKRVLLIGGDALGRGSGELGLLLMRNFIYTLTRTESPPGTIIFLNAGVKLTTAGSPVLEELARLRSGEWRSSPAAPAWTTTG